MRQLMTSSSSACQMIWTVLNWFYLMIGTYCIFPPAFQVMSPTLYPFFGWEFVVPSCCCHCSESWDERLEPARSQRSLRWAGKHRTSGFGTNFGPNAGIHPQVPFKKRWTWWLSIGIVFVLQSSYSHPQMDDVPVGNASGDFWGGWGIQLRTEIAPNSLKQPPTIPNLSKL